jgi:hypothetical protein
MAGSDKRENKQPDKEGYMEQQGRFDQKGERGYHEGAPDRQK